VVLVELREDAVRLAILVLILSVGAGCTTVVVKLPEPDASAADASDAAGDVEDATVADAGADADATIFDASTADAAPDAMTPDPVCVDADNPDCCFGGQPIRVGLTCGDYPASADAACNSVGVCHPRFAQQCSDVNACCDGWTPIQIVYGAPCHCEIDYDADPPFVTESPYHRACKNLPNEGAGNAMGYCGMEYAGALFNGRPTQYTCISNTVWTP
jgi:hypothetical protein